MRARLLIAVLLLTPALALIGEDNKPKKGAVRVSPTETLDGWCRANPALSADIKPVREIVLSHTTRNIRVRLEGDAVRAMDNFDTDYHFFEPIA